MYEGFTTTHENKYNWALETRFNLERNNISVWDRYIAWRNDEPDGSIYLWEQVFIKQMINFEEKPVIRRASHGGGFNPSGHPRLSGKDHGPDDLMMCLIFMSGVNRLWKNQETQNVIVSDLNPNNRSNKAEFRRKNVIMPATAEERKALYKKVMDVFVDY
jgi:hypothetical protein